MNKEDIEELKREIKALKQANIEYKDNINAGLNFIKRHQDDRDGDLYLTLYEVDKLNLILKGDIYDYEVLNGNICECKVLRGESND